MKSQLYCNDFVEFVQDIYKTEDFIPLHAPCFGDMERSYVLETLDSTFVSSVGQYVDEFESRLSKYTGAKYVVATINGTAALHVALMMSGVQPEDEVITSPLTFVATCNAVHYCGARPLFVDVEWDTLGLSPESLAIFLDDCGEVRDDRLCWNKKSNRIIRACIPIHNLGHPARVKEIEEICKAYNILVIEDAAESLGSFTSGVHTGRIGQTGILSFNGNKIITTGGGGALITDDKEVARRAKHLTTTAKQAHPWLFLHDEIGYNYRLPNINAALGCAQMEQLPTHVNKKRKLAHQYKEWFSKKDIEFVSEPSGASSNYWLNSIVLSNIEDRDEFLTYTNSHNVMTRAMWTPMHTLPMYRSCYRTNMANAEAVEKRLVNIPSSVV